MRPVCTSVTLVALLACSPIAARADVVLDWNAIAVSTMIGQSPYAQSRFMAITQLAVFEAVNAITGDYKPYLGTVVAPAGASADAAAVTAAYQVLKNYFPTAAANLDAAYAMSLAAIPNGSAKNGGIATGQAAAAQMIALRLNDGSSPPQFYQPTSTDPGVWQFTPSCPASGGVAFQWPEHDTVRCTERSRQPGVDRAVCPGSAAGAHQHAIRAGLQRVEAGRQHEQRSHRAAAGSRRCGAVLRHVVAGLRVQPGRAAGCGRGGHLDVEECACPRAAQHGQQRQPRRVVLDEVSLQAVAARDGDFRGQPGWQPTNRSGHDLCAVHSHAVFPQLSVESREREQRRRRGPEACLR